jgi:hypothetical protein
MRGFRMLGWEAYARVANTAKLFAAERVFKGNSPG